ncbi:uncharacterized protein TRIADDRAFT_62262 [Trichoplax adhaerens]|uniref:Uncharacterized protein n=1 Tax=Trichoplax adhaerens TaxID=10228 RepID=B3SDA4_TRIAD|nr:hypothetical protein TRIADDRAFT_62262 [Trichoplax adhaerens]EDV19284.1 hypothetical protein TRIADDRAFT_62262 [Trichoplax adhaerens]|eukprot:XP_002118208.1 hypothetical protein TRIADDRAFT_62262 [Trichoplax adhaerens]
MGNAGVKPLNETKSINGSRVVLIDDDWKNQTKNCESFEVYKYVDFKGGGSLVDSYIEGENEKTQAIISQSQITKNLLGEQGCGIFTKLSQFTPTQLLCNDKSRDTDPERCDGDYDTVDGDDEKLLVCWDTNKRGAVGETPLHICFLINQDVHRAIAKCLLQAYPAMAHDIYIKPEYYGESCVHIAIVNDDEELLKILIDECHASIHQRARGSFFMPESQRKRIKDSLPLELDTLEYEGYAYYGEYPLAFAACFERKDMYDYLLDKGAQVNAQDTFGNTILHLLIIHNKLDMISYVMKHTSVPNRSIKNKAGLTPLTLATQLGYNDSFEKLLELESQIAWKYGDIQCCVYPLKHLDSIGPDGRTNLESALALAVAGESDGHLEMVNSGVIYRLLDEKWKAYAKKNFVASFIAACFYLAFMSTAIYTRSSYDLLSPRQPSDYVRYVFEILTLISAIMYLGLQSKAIHSNGMSVYLRSLYHVPTHASFVLSCICFLLCIPGRFIPGGRSYEDIVVVFGVLFAWIGLLFYCRGISFLGPFVEMISRMLSGDIARFIIIYVIFILAMTQAYFFMYKACGSKVFDSEFGTMMALFKMTIGHFPWAETVIVLERSISPSQLLQYQKSYCCNMSSDDNDSESSMPPRGLMVIKRVDVKGISAKWKSRSRAALEQRKIWNGLYNIRN